MKRRFIRFGVVAPAFLKGGQDRRIQPSFKKALRLVKTKITLPYSN
jgi:hypothetical protein